MNWLLTIWLTTPTGMTELPVGYMATEDICVMVADSISLRIEAENPENDLYYRCDNMGAGV